MENVFNFLTFHHIFPLSRKDLQCLRNAALLYLATRPQDWSRQTQQRKRIVLVDEIGNVVQNYKSMILAGQLRGTHQLFHHQARGALVVP